MENPIVSVLTLGAGTNPAIGLSGTAPIPIQRSLDSNVMIPCGSGAVWLAGTGSFRLNRALESSIVLSSQNRLDATGASHRAIKSSLRLPVEASGANPSYERPIKSDLRVSRTLSLLARAGRLNPVNSDIDLGKYVDLFGEARALRAIDSVVTAGNDGLGGVQVNAALRKTLEFPPLGELSLLSGESDVLFNQQTLISRQSATLELLVMGKRLRTYNYRVTFSLEPTFTQPEKVWLNRGWSQHRTSGMIIRGEITPIQTARGSEEELTLQLPLLSGDTAQFQSAATSWFVAEASDDYGERHILATGSFVIAPGVLVV